MSFEINDDLYPFSSVVFIKAYWGEQVYTGSGALIGPNDVLTASHVIYQKSLGGLADRIEVYPSYDPDDGPFQPYFEPYLVNYYPNFDPDGDGRLIPAGFTYALEGSELDIALLSLVENVGNVTGYFGGDPNFTFGLVSVVGYPGKYGTQPYYDEGIGQKVFDANVIQKISGLETNSGNSGGPVYYIDPIYGDAIIVGVVSTGIAITSLKEHWWWLRDAIDANDYRAPFPTYTVVPINSVVNEGDSAHFRIDTTQLREGTLVSYTISGVSVDDINRESLSGVTTVDSNGSAYVNVSTKADKKTEGVENLFLTVENSSNFVRVNDTSLTEVAKALQLKSLVINNPEIFVSRDNFRNDNREAIDLQAEITSSSGFKSGYVGFQGSEGNFFVWFDSEGLISGTVFDGVFSSKSYMEKGGIIEVKDDPSKNTYEITRMVLNDDQGNSYSLFPEDLAASGILVEDLKVNVSYLSSDGLISGGLENKVLSIGNLTEPNILDGLGIKLNVAMPDGFKILQMTFENDNGGSYKQKVTISVDPNTDLIEGSLSNGIFQPSHTDMLYKTGFSPGVAVGVKEGSYSLTQLTITDQSGKDYGYNAFHNADLFSLLKSNLSFSIEAGTPTNFLSSSTFSFSRENESFIAPVGIKTMDLYQAHLDKYAGINGNPHANFKWDSFNFSRDESDNDVWYMYDEWHGGVDKFQGYKRFEVGSQKTVALDIDGGDTGGMVYRLYQAAFARKPDEPGLGWHLNDIERHELSIKNVANNFLNSPEFKGLYGENPSDEDYINALYQNVLGRSADPITEVAWYENQFNTGAMDRAAALIGFAESPENISLVAPEIENGFVYWQDPSWLI